MAAAVAAHAAWLLEAIIPRHGVQQPMCAIAIE